MRILMISDFYSPRRGGIETQLSGLVHALRSLGHTVQVCTPWPGEEEFGVDRIPLFRPLGAPLTSDPRTRRAITKQVQSFCPDVVHSHASVLSPFAAVGASVAAHEGLPSLLTFHSLLGRWLAVWKSLPRTVTLGAPSPVVAAELRALGLPVIDTPNGIHVKFWDQARTKAPATGIRVSAVMRFAPRKRPFALLDALRAAGPGITLRVAGQGVLEHPLRVGARLAKVSMQFAGWLAPAALRDFYQTTDVLLHPTVQEACGLAVLEAAAAGVVPVVRAGSGPASLLGPAAVCAADDDSGLGRSLKRLAADKGELASRAEAARHYVKRFDWQHVVKAHEDAYAAIGAKSTGNEASAIAHFPAR